MFEHGAPCWYELTASKVEEAQAFYTALLSWQIADSGTPGMDYRVAKLGDTMVAGLMPPAHPDMPAAWMIYFAVTSADDTHAAALAAGATSLVPPSDIPGTGRFAILRDPQGAAFGILQPLPGGTGGAFDQTRPGAGNWHEIISPDAAAAIAFYGPLFGWNVARSVDMGAMVYHILSQNGVESIGAFSMPGAASWRPYFGVTSAHAAVSAVTAAGGQVRSGPDEIPGGVFTLQITDAAGATLALVGPA